MTSTSTPAASFTTSLTVDQSPQEVFAAVADVRGWWSENIEGPTDTAGAEFTYHHQDAHRCTIRVTEITSPTRLVWQVVDNYFNFTADATEWQGTEIRFDIAPKGSQTELRFTHAGLVPAYECFDVCSNAWDFYLHTSLGGLIRTGQGLPNPLEPSTPPSFRSTLSVPQSAQDVFAAVTNPRKWWTGDIEGRTDHVGDEFSYRYGDNHYSQQVVTELVPGEKVVWKVVDSCLPGHRDPSEWTGTQIIFEIATATGGATELRFSHVGLVSELECFEACSSAWGFYINHSLRRLITTGEGPQAPPWA